MNPERAVAMMALLLSAGLQAQQFEQTNADFQAPLPVKNIVDIPLQTTEFTFVRIAYSTTTRPSYRSTWNVDYPDADQKFASEVARVTGLSVEPDGLALELTDPALQQYPFSYLVEGGYLRLSDEEVVALRSYLLGGGFLMVDDFHGLREWDGFAQQLRRAFPDVEPIDLSIDHEVFRSFYEFHALPRVPPRAGDRADLDTHYRGLVDSNGRLMAIFCHNSDFGDGWEHADDPWYPQEFSHGAAFPMGINIVVYALSH